MSYLEGGREAEAGGKHKENLIFLCFFAFLLVNYNSYVQV